MEETQMRRPRPRAPRPPPGSYRPITREMHHFSDWGGRYSPGAHQINSGSSSRNWSRRSRSPDVYGRATDRSAWSGDVTDDRARSKGGRYEDSPRPTYGDDQYRYDYEGYEYRSGERPEMRHKSGGGGPPNRPMKGEFGMEAPSRRPIQLDRYMSY
jgi:hypothetical protein